MKAILLVFGIAFPAIGMCFSAAAQNGEKAAAFYKTTSAQLAAALADPLKFDSPAKGPGTVDWVLENSFWVSWRAKKEDGKTEARYERLVPVHQVISLDGPTGDLKSGYIVFYASPAGGVESAVLKPGDVAEAFVKMLDRREHE